MKITITETNKETHVFEDCRLTCIFDDSVEFITQGKFKAFSYKDNHIWKIEMQIEEKDITK